jgi:hypothetical protein
MATENVRTLERSLAPAAGGWSHADPFVDARTRLHREPFHLSHHLEDHPLFSIDSLMKVAASAERRKSDMYIDAGDVAITDKWGKIPAPQLPVTEILERIENAGAWIILKRVEQDPAYAQVLDEFTTFIRGVAGPELARNFTNPEMLVLITSPNRITPFHFDAEINFLVQIHGSKDVWICDPHDRDCVSEIDIERYYAVETTAGTYKPDVEQRARHFHLVPGQAVHIPTHGAHWVKNGHNVSVSLSLNYEFPRHVYRDVYYANHHLRRLGLKPRPPGASALADRLKSTSIGLARKLGSAARTLKNAARRT